MHLLQSVIDLGGIESPCEDESDIVNVRLDELQSRVEIMWQDIQALKKPQCSASKKQPIPSPNGGLKPATSSQKHLFKRDPPPVNFPDVKRLKVDTAAKRIQKKKMKVSPVSFVPSVTPASSKSSKQIVRSAQPVQSVQSAQPVQSVQSAISLVVPKKDPSNWTVARSNQFVPLTDEEKLKLYIDINKLDAKLKRSYSLPLC